MKSGDRIGPYRIVKRLGEGGIGEVFLAVDEPLARHVAIKRLRPEHAEREALVSRFRAEAQTLARLNHPNIATLYALVEEGEATYMVMEYVDGETVATLLRQRGALKLEPALRLAFQALAGIGCAHDRGVIHRDIKGSNLMLDANGTLKVMDFGIARVVGDDRHTHAGQLIGTPEFMAPEQIRGEDADERSDLYALAILLFSLFTGRAPFQAKSEYDLMKAHVEEQPPSLLDYCPGLPPELDAVLRKGLAKEAAERFQSATQFRSALQPFAHESWSDGPLFWPARTRTEAECTLLGDADLDAATEVGADSRTAKALPLIDAEWLDAAADDAFLRSSEALTAAFETEPTLDFGAATDGAESSEPGRRVATERLSLLASWARSPRLVAAGFALGALMGIDFVLVDPHSDARDVQATLSNVQLEGSLPANATLGSQASARELREILFSANQSRPSERLDGIALPPGPERRAPAVSARGDGAKAAGRVGRSTNIKSTPRPAKDAKPTNQGEVGWVIRR